MKQEITLTEHGNNLPITIDASKIVAVGEAKPSDGVRWTYINYERGDLAHCVTESREEVLAKIKAWQMPPHWDSERRDVIVQLRDVCEDFGDNDWPDNLHLGDVIEKHLARHLHAASDE